MKIFCKKRSGVVLTEALVSVALLALASVILGSIITSAYQMTFFSRNYMIAQSLATEGIEGVISLRDTNWLIDPNNKDCWLRTDPEPEGSCKLENLVGIDNSYILVQKNDGRWELQYISQPLDLEDPSQSSNENFHLYEKSFGDVSSRYVHKEAGNDSSPFYREVKFIEFVQPDYAVFDVKVQWNEGKKVRTLLQSYRIYNYI